MGIVGARDAINEVFGQESDSLNALTRLATHNPEGSVCVGSAASAGVSRRKRKKNEEESLRGALLACAVGFITRPAARQYTSSGAATQFDTHNGIGMALHWRQKNASVFTCVMNDNLDES